MARLITGLDPDRIRANLAEIRAEVEAAARTAGRDPGEVEILAAVKYVPERELGALAQAGVALVGENRAQDLVSRASAHPERFTWDFIGQLQSRKVKQILAHVRLIHSVASDSALAQLERHGGAATEVLVEVNVAGEESKGGVAPAQLGTFIARCPVRVGGLMTLPPPAESPEESRAVFAALRELAAEHGLARLSMGTSQDFAVAVQEGATIVRIGQRLYR